MFVVAYRKIFYTFSILLIGLSVFALSTWGLNLGIDFKGGSIIEISYISARPPQADVAALIGMAGVKDAQVRASGSNSYIIRTRTLTEAEHEQVAGLLMGTATTTSGSITAQTTSPQAEIKHFDTVGPILGQELQSKALWSIIFVIIAIVLFITFAFRKVSKPVASWKYGLVAIVALLHDVIVPVGVFALLGHVVGYEVDALFVTAILVVLGFSVHDTIVVFDRTRENLTLASNAKKPFDQIVGESVSQTFARSINTSLTTILALIALYFFGPESTRMFSLALIVGIAAGTYSSIFIGSPLLVTLQKFQKR